MSKDKPTPNIRRKAETFLWLALAYSALFAAIFIASGCGKEPRDRTIGGVPPGEGPREPSPVSTMPMTKAGCPGVLTRG